MACIAKLGRKLSKNTLGRKFVRQVVSNKVNQFERIKFKGITGDKKNSRYIEIIRSFTEMCY